MNILMLSDEFNHCCGVSKHIFYLLKEIKDNVGITMVIPGGSALDLLKENEIPFIIEPAISYKERNYRNFIKGLLSILRIVRKDNIDIIHCHNHYLSNMSKLIMFFSRGSVVQTIHSDFDHSGKLKKYWADFYIFVNKHIYMTAAKENCISPHNSTLIYNGIPITQNKYEVNKGKSKINILLATRLIESKGVQTVIQALSILSSEYLKELEISVAGIGDYEVELKNMALAKKINMHFLGEVADMNELFRKSDIFIFPSYKDTFPISIIEASMQECFVISSDFDGVKSVLRSDIDGFIYSKYSHEELTSKIKSAIDLGKKRNEYVQRFNNEITNRFSSSEMANKTVEIYSMLGQKGKNDY